MRTILIVDENADVRESLRLMFSGCADYRVATASNGMDAILKAKKIKPDIVLTDVSLSDKNGYEISREIKNNPLLNNTSVILLISSFEAFDEGMAADALADDFMIKPFNPEETRKKVESLIKQYEKKEDEKVMDKRGSEPSRTIRLSIENRDNSYGLTEESAQELKMAIRMAAKKARERRNILNQIPTKAEYPRVPLYRRRDLVAVLSLSIVLLVTVMFNFQNTFKGLRWVEDEIKAYETGTPHIDENGEKTASRVLDISISDNGSQPRLNLGSGTPPPDGKTLEETPRITVPVIPAEGNIRSEGTKGKTSSLKGRTRKIYKRKSKGLRGRTQPTLASNIRKKEPLEQQLRTAFLLYNP